RQAAGRPLRRGGPSHRPGARLAARPDRPAARRADRGAGPRHRAVRRVAGAGLALRSAGAGLRLGQPRPRPGASRLPPARAPAGWRGRAKMTGAYHHLTPLQVGLAAALVLVNAALSLALRLGLGQRLLVAAGRLVVQLLLVGLVLQWVFANARWYTVVSLAA